MSTTYDFGNGPVSAHRHPNGGGWVADTATVAATAFVGPDAQIFGNAKVFDDAQVFGDAKIYGNAQVFGDAMVSGDARIYGDVRVTGDAHIFGDAEVCGGARVNKGRIVAGVHNKQPLTSRVDGWLATLSDRDHISIGCQSHSLSEWRSSLYAIAEEHNAVDAIEEAQAFLDECEKRLSGAESV